MQYFAAVIILTLVSGCSLFTYYAGDGQLTDHGWFLIGGRAYTIDLGPVDLTQRGTYSYCLNRPPVVKWVIGLDVLEPVSNPPSDPRTKHRAKVRIRLETSDNHLVVLEEGPVETWRRSTGFGDQRSFYTRDGEGRELPLDGGGGTRYQRLGERADSGWGTYFNPRPDATYVLSLEVLEPDPQPRQPARLLVYGRESL
jgi:hypothetical protein